MLRGSLALALSLVLASGVSAADPVARLAGARKPGAVREAALQLGKALEGGCCFGREREIARLIAGRLATCPRDPALVNALAYALEPIAHALVIEDPTLARHAAIEQPLQCMRTDPGSWPAYAVLPMGAGGLALAQHDPQMAAGMIAQLLEHARGQPGRVRQVLDWLTRLSTERGVALPPLDRTLVDAFIDTAGNGLYDLVTLFSKFPGRAGTEALLRLAERRDLAVPPELARWAKAGDIRAQALRKLGSRRLEPRDLERVARLARDADQRVAGAARTLLEAQGRSRTEDSAAGETGTHAPRDLIHTLTSGADSDRVRAAAGLAAYLRGHPGEHAAREALRRAAEGDADARVRARAWVALLVTRDRRFTWERLLARLRAPATRERVLETLARFDTPVPAELLESLPDALPRTLLDIAATPGDTQARVKALRILNRVSRWPAGEGSTGAHARALADRFSRLAEPRVRSLLTDRNAEVRRAAAGFFAAVPAREPATIVALLAATGDASRYVRDEAAAALATLRSVPPGFARRLAERLARGDADKNVARRLRDAYAAALCADPQAQERLAAVILYREGDGVLRQTLASHCRLEGEAARKLLHRLGGTLVDRLAASRGGPLAELVRAGDDPPPWALIRRMVPAGVRDAWLLQQAAVPSLGWKARMALLARMEARDAPRVRQELLGWLVKGVRAGGIDAAGYLKVFAPLGYAGIRALADAFAQDERNLARARELMEQAQAHAARCAAAASSCGSVPEPGAEDIPGIAKRIRAVAHDAPRLALLVRLLNLYALGRDMELQRRAWEAGITPTLLEAMGRPGGCEAVRPAIHSLLGRMKPPVCQ